MLPLYHVAPSTLYPRTSPWPSSYSIVRVSWTERPQLRGLAEQNKRNYSVPHILSRKSMSSASDDVSLNIQVMHYKEYSVVQRGNWAPTPAASVLRNQSSHKSRHSSISPSEMSSSESSRTTARQPVFCRSDPRIPDTVTDSPSSPRVHVQLWGNVEPSCFPHFQLPRFLHRHARKTHQACEAVPSDRSLLVQRRFRIVKVQRN